MNYHCIDCKKIIEHINVEEHEAGQGRCTACKYKFKQSEIDELRKYFCEPVLPMSIYCGALETWMRCIEELQRDMEITTPPEYRHGASYASHLSKIYTDIKKSGLLDRLIYRYPTDPVRTRKCPIHKGKMDTGMWVGVTEDRSCGCSGSGWLPEPGSIAEEEFNKLIICSKCKDETKQGLMYHIISIIEGESGVFCPKCYRIKFKKA
jgi:DNA-directed RNA polymerase subunit RPC12/RpoP